MKKRAIIIFEYSIWKDAYDYLLDKCIQQEQIKTKLRRLL